MIQSSFTKIRSHVRTHTGGLSASAISDKLASQGRTQDPNPNNNPTCECPSCKEITDVSIMIMNPGDTRDATCSYCESEFTLHFNEDGSWTRESKLE